MLRLKLVCLAQLLSTVFMKTSPTSTHWQDDGVAHVSVWLCVSVSLRTLLMPFPILAEPLGSLAHRCAPSLLTGRGGDGLPRRPSSGLATSQTHQDTSERCCSSAFKRADHYPSSPRGTVGVVVSGTERRDEKRSGTARISQVFRDGFGDTSNIVAFIYTDSCFR